MNRFVVRMMQNEMKKGGTGLKKSSFNGEGRVKKGGATQYVDLTMNGQSVIKTSWDTAASSAMMSDTPVPIIIPPYTQVECLVGVSSGTDEWTTQLVGRIYRTRD